MKHENPDLAEKNATPVRPSRRDLLLQVAAYFDRHPTQNFGTVKQIEYCADDVVRSRSTADTAFEPIVKALSNAGVTTEQTLGSLMDNLPMTRIEAHDLACSCNGHKMDGAAVAERLRSLAASS